MEIKEIILKNILIRYKILEWLYLLNQEDKFTNLGGIINQIGYPKEEILSNLKFLRDEKLIQYKENINREPIAKGWGTGIKITDDGQRFIEEIELSKKGRGKKASQWLLANASWIIQYLPQVIKLIMGGAGN
jgi:hypothetical protein